MVQQLGSIILHIQMKFDTPILLIAWRRPEHLKQVIDAVRKVSPKNVFVAVDGPREGDGFAEERKLIEQTKIVIDNEIDWNCELKTLYQERNLGCKIGVSSAITWFFDHVEDGIILEDDCVPNVDFLRFASEMLVKYKDETKVMHIGGVNYLDLVRPNEYYLSQYGHIWGWATWKKSWQKYQANITQAELKIAVLNIPFGEQREYWYNIFKGQIELIVDTWDYNWQYTIFLNNGCCIYPLNTMVENIGFDELATHTKTVKVQSKLFKSESMNKKSNIARYWFSNKITNRYFDHINFRRSFKNKTESIKSIKALFKWILSIIS